LGNHDYGAGMGETEILDRILLLREADLRPGSYNVSVMGTGDVDTGYADTVVRELEMDGVRVLRNEAVTVDLGGKNLTIVGLDDCWAGRTRPPAMPDTGAFTIYLIHEPECRAAWEADLILAGHTHGGQFVAGIPQALDAAGALDLSGLKMRGGVPTYITRGVGTSNFNPELRFLVPPEIVAINPSG
ncbi:MAG: metallophosphoesterase, partial [Methanomicrobiales archaeon]|nr:metallophosphoesterase [Methanomicrobiales archaeon]